MEFLTQVRIIPRTGLVYSLTDMKPSKKNTLLMLRESNAIEDVFDGYALVNAHRAWKHLMQFDQVNNQVIKETHRLLMVGQPIEWEYRGDWRDIPVWIGGEKKSQPKIVIDSLMRDWCEETNTVDRNFDPVTLHIKFESIHPFVDGNGRMGRLLLNWHLVKRNHAPLLIYTRQDRHTYYMLFPSYRRRIYDKMYESVLESPGLAKRMEKLRKDNMESL